MASDKPNMRVKISVVVPNYNHSHYLAQRLSSIFDQTEQNIEVILLDDASTDGSVEILQKHASDPRVRLLINETNSGSTFCQWNKGVQMATGKYVWIAESDDVAFPTLLETLINQLEDHPSCVVAHCHSEFIDQQSLVTGNTLVMYDAIKTGKWQQDHCNSGQQECAEHLINYCTIPNASAVVFRREAYLACGGAREDLKLCGDWLLWGRMLTQGDIAFSAKILNKFRTHPSTVRSQTAKFSACKEAFQVMEELSRKFKLSSSQWRRLHWHALMHWWNMLVQSPQLPSRSEIHEIIRNAHFLGPWVSLKFNAAIIFCLLFKSRPANLFKRYFKNLRRSAPQT